MAAILKPNPGGLLNVLDFGMYQQAAKRGVSLTEMLRKDDPDEDYTGEDRAIGPVGRILKFADIRTRSFPRRGIEASTYEEWHSHDRARVLIPEFFVRTFQAALESHRASEENRISRMVEAQVRAIMDSSDSALGSAVFPYFENPNVDWSTQVTPVIPLTEIIAGEVSSTSDGYRTTRLVRVTADLRVSRVAEGTEIPRMRVTTSDFVNRLFKYGLGVEWTYETLRRMKIDEIGRITAEIAVQQEIDKVSAAADIAYNGDGSPNSAAQVYNLTALDSAAVVPNVTLAAWVAFKMKFVQPYSLTTALGTVAAMQQLLLLNTGSANIPLVMIQAPQGLGSFTAINPGLRDNVAIGWTTDIPASKILGFDRRRALRRAYEVNSQIREIERFVLRQTETFVMSENEAFVVQDPDAALVLNLAA
jgi:hypothetical protein